MNELTLIQKLVVFIVPLVFAITVHEAAHGWMANRSGDPTARVLGRITLNPIPHIDPIGTILVPLAMYAISALSGGAGIMFGWAKPVPIDPRNFRNLRRDMALVAVAGPASNLLMLVIWALVIRLALALDFAWMSTPLLYMGQAGIFINALLMILNLLPILPLDGGRVLAALLPPAAAVKYSRLEPYGFFILIALLFTGLLGPILWPAMKLAMTMGMSMAGLL